VLPGCAAVVHHGGGGTMFGSLAHGLSQVVVPQGSDNFRNAALLEATGASCTVLPDAVAPRANRTAVRAVLDEPGFLAAAGALRAEIDAMPAADAVAAELRRLAVG
jgi:UDP:flavonoid glycosyltransferase YjiC (YdhE family)